MAKNKSESSKSEKTLNVNTIKDEGILVPILDTDGESPEGIKIGIKKGKLKKPSSPNFRPEKFNYKKTRKIPQIIKKTLLFISLGGVLLFALVHLYLLALRFVAVPITFNMVLNSDPFQRQIIPLEQISSNLVTAVIAAEDTRFCQHKGIDIEALEKAMEDNQKNGRRRGGSTISQQTAKNVIFWNGGGYIRKAGEAYITLVIELLWPKQRIMEHYLNIADWGDGIYGAETAAQVRFNKSAKNLSEREAALLASVLPNPHKWRVDPPGDYVSKRVGTIQARMATLKRDGFADCVLN